MKPIEIWRTVCACLALHSACAQALNSGMFQFTARTKSTSALSLPGICDRFG